MTGVLADPSTRPARIRGHSNAGGTLQNPSDLRDTLRLESLAFP